MDEDVFADGENVIDAADQVKDRTSEWTQSTSSATGSSKDLDPDDLREIMNSLKEQDGMITETREVKSVIGDPGLRSILNEHAGQDTAVVEKLKEMKRYQSSAKESIFEWATRNGPGSSIKTWVKFKAAQKGRQLEGRELHQWEWHNTISP